MGLPGIHIPNPLNKGAPDAPDYKGAAEATARSGRPNQISPWASSTWSSGPSMGSGSRSIMDVMHGTGGAGAGDGRDTQTMALSGPLDAANSSMGSQLASAWANPLDNGAQARQHAEDAIYQRAASRLDPMWGQREQAFNTGLANQGIDPNSAAGQAAFGNFGRSRNDAYSSALMDAIMGGGQEASRQQQMDLTGRMAPLWAMSGIKGLSSMPGTPPGANYLGAALAQGQYGMDAQKMNTEFWKDIMSGASAAATGGASGAAGAYGGR